MIKLFNINNFKVDTALFGNHLNGHYVQELEENFASYVGAKYACALNKNEKIGKSREIMRIDEILDRIP